MSKISLKSYYVYYDRYVSLLIFYLKKKAAAPAILSLLLLSVFIPSYRIAYVEDSDNLFSITRKSDFEDYFIASQTLARGADPYKMEDLEQLKKQFVWEDLGSFKKIKDFMKRVKRAGTYLYPPLTAFLLLPVSGMSYQQATVVFQSVSILMFLLFLLILYRHTGRSGFAPEFFIPAVLTTLLLYNFLAGNFLHGNVLSFLLILVGGGLFLSFREEKVLSAAGGFLIGIAVVIKVTPVFFGLVLLGRKRFFSIAGMGAGVLAGFLLPSVYTGFDENLVLLNNWYNLIIGSYSKIGFVRPWANNQSIAAMIGKLFVFGSDAKQVLYGLPLFSGGFDVTGERTSFLISVTRTINLILFAAAIAVSILSLVRNFRKKIHLDEGAVHLMFLAALASLLTAGVSWYHAYGILFLPIFLRLKMHFNNLPLRKGEKISYFLVSIFGLFSLLFGKYFNEALALYSIFTFICAGIFVYTAGLFLREKNGF